jgi:arginine/lysine/ornithine decarboxylase
MNIAYPIKKKIIVARKEHLNILNQLIVEKMNQIFLNAKKN